MATKTFSEECRPPATRGYGTRWRNARLAMKPANITSEHGRGLPDLRIRRPQGASRHGTDRMDIAVPKALR